MHQLAEILKARGNHIDAYNTLGNLRGRLERSVGDNNEELLWVDENIITTLLCREEYGEAEVQSRKLIAAATKTHGSDGCLTVRAMHCLACAVGNQGRWRDAIGMFRSAFEIARKHPDVSYPDYIKSGLRLVQALQRIGSGREAREIAESFLEKEAAGKRQENVAVRDMLREYGGIIRSYYGDFGEAERIQKKALQLSRKLGGDNDDATRGIRFLLATVHIYQKKCALATGRLQYLLQSSTASSPRVNSNLRKWLAFAHVYNGDYDKAKHLYQEVIESTREDEDDPARAGAQHGLASIFGDKGDFESAKTLYESALSWRKAENGPDHPDTLASMIGLASTLRLRREFTEAKSLVTTALSTSKLTLGSNHSRTIEARDVLAYLRTDMLFEWLFGLRILFYVRNYTRGGSFHIEAEPGSLVDWSKHLIGITYVVCYLVYTWLG